MAFTTLLTKSAGSVLVIFFLIFPRKQDLTFHANCLQWKNISKWFLHMANWWYFSYFSYGDNFLEKIRKNISKCCLLKILPWVLSPLRERFFVSGTGLRPSLVPLLQSLRKHTYSNILKLSPPKTENFQIKNSDIFHISALNIECGYSLELPHWGHAKEYQ